MTRKLIQVRYIYI